MSEDSEEIEKLFDLFQGSSASISEPKWEQNLYICENNVVV